MFRIICLIISLLLLGGCAAVADLLAREGRGFRLPTREQVAAYMQKNELPFSLET